MRTALALALLVIAAVGLVRTANSGPSTATERSDAVAASLRCPTCEGLSVEDSTSPMAGSMREIIDDKIADGESDEQIRQYFVDRYSDWVLLNPPASGGGWLIWVVPLLVGVAGIVIVLVLAGRIRLPRRAGWAVVLVGVGMVVILSLQTNSGDRHQDGLITGSDPAAADEQPSGGEVPEGSASDDGGPEAAERRLEKLRSKVSDDPDDAETRLALAAEALSLGRADLVREQAAAVLEDEPRNVDALLLRSLSVTGRDDDEGVEAVRDYLALAPEGHPGRTTVEPLAEQLGVSTERP